MYKKLKPYLADDLVFTSLLLCGVAVLAFFLGRASVVPTTVGSVGLISSAPAPTPTLITGTSTDATTTVVATTPIIPMEKNYVASKSGTKYHHVSCPGAKQIKESNKIYFATANDAKAAGYSQASNCRVP